jgi:hypothetical protein
LGLPGRAVTVPCADFVVFATPAVTVPWTDFVVFAAWRGDVAFCGR